MTHDEMIAVLTHHKNGGNVQVKHIITHQWYDCDEVQSWNFTNYEYRAKPEPHVIYADFDDHGDAHFCSREKYTPPFGRKLRKFVEVEE
jgi:hypothetical protein